MSRDPSETIVLTYREEGVIDRRRLSGILGAATTLLLLLLIVALSLGAIGAAGVGIGGFVVEFSDVTAPSGSVYPAIAQQSNCEAAPQLTATLNGQAVIQDYFRVTKGIPLPGNTIDGVSVDILSEAGNGTNITAQDLELRLVHLKTQAIVLQNATISEYNVETPSGEEPSPSQSYIDVSDSNSNDFNEVGTEFAIDAPGGFALRNGSAVVYHIAFGDIQINDIGVTGSLADSGNMSLAGTRSNECPETYQMRNSPQGVPNSTSPTVEPSEPEVPEGDAEMEIVSVSPDPDSSLNVGDTFVVEANITNVGNATDTWTAYMNVWNGSANETVDTQNVTVEVNETVGVVVEHEVRSRDLPNLKATLGIDEPEIVFGDGRSGEREDNAPEPEPEINIVDAEPGADEPLEVGDTFTVDLNVTNVGNATGDWRVYMNVTDDAGENTTVASENVSLRPGEGANVTFGYEATPSDVPTVDATLGVDDLD